MTKTEKFFGANKKNIIAKFKDNISQNKKSNYTTHIIEYIFTQNDLELCTYHDIYELFSANINNVNCIFDIMMITLKEASFVHIEKDKYDIKRIDIKKFFLEETFEIFMKIVKKNAEGYENINKIFVFGGHCDGWYCYCEKYIVNFNMIRNLFIKYNLTFDLICFDSCYTSSLEIAYQFYDISKYISAHQTYVNAEG